MYDDITGCGLLLYTIDRADQYICVTLTSESERETPASGYQ